MYKKNLFIIAKVLSGLHRFLSISARVACGNSFEGKKYF